VWPREMSTIMQQQAALQCRESRCAMRAVKGKRVPPTKV
jgi:hypothetical protein